MVSMNEMYQEVEQTGFKAFKPMCPFTRKPCVDFCEWKRNGSCAIWHLINLLNSIDTSLQLLQE